MAGQNYQDLKAWQVSMDLVEKVYAETRSWPKEELYGLSSQIRRAAVSVPSNIAEGQGRRSSKDFGRMLSIAHGSLREVETQIQIALRLGYLPADRAQGLLSTSSEAGRLITGLINSIERSLP